MVEQGTHKPLVGGSNPPSATSPGPLAPIVAALASGADALAIRNGASLLLAVSGGPDSMALLHAAARVAADRDWTLAVAHLDHALRVESSTDAAFVADAAAALGTPATVRRVDVAMLARDEHRSPEDAGREARYRCFDEVAAPDALIVTAHTADPPAETIVLNLVRGSGLAGAAGIPARRGRVIRPLLGARRFALRAALDAAGIAYLRDPTNDDVHYARNRIRLEVLPALERINPNVVNALLRFGRLAADDDEALDLIARGELERRRSGDGGIDWRRPPSRAIGRRVMRLAIGQPAPSAERIEALLDAAEGGRGGVWIELGGGRQASVRERVIRIG